jgi:hypothetical protein
MANEDQRKIAKYQETGHESIVAATQVRLESRIIAIV